MLCVDNYESALDFLLVLKSFGFNLERSSSCFVQTPMNLLETFASFEIIWFQLRKEQSMLCLDKYESALGFLLVVKSFGFKLERSSPCFV